ncbi:MAG TPA: NAD(P)H-dependent oxidoreductase subunit E [Thermoleophilaceae bacterium]|nr:NAD(P)H-dependent oxidoreductase subunit E [Thermoleophilaceae bacterium]
MTEYQDEGRPQPDRVGEDAPMGTPAGDQAVPVGDPTAAPASGAAAPLRADRDDLPPNVTRPMVPEGWDRAADLEKDPAVIPDPAETPVPDDLRAEIERLMALYPDRRSATIPALHAAQAVHGWCSPEALTQVAVVMQVTPAYLSSVASFYDMLNEQPVGRRHVYVCTSVACHLVNAKAVYEAIAEEAERTGLEDTEVRQFECLGACDMAPMASVDGRFIGPLDPSDAPEIVDSIREGRQPLPGRGLEDSDYRLPWGGRA